MPLKTPEQYVDSLRDGRRVIFRGERVADVTAHPVIGVAVRHAAIDYRMAEEPRYRDLAVAGIVLAALRGMGPHIPKPKLDVRRFKL